MRPHSVAYRQAGLPVGARGVVPAPERLPARMSSNVVLPAPAWGPAADDIFRFCEYQPSERVDAGSTCGMTSQGVICSSCYRRGDGVALDCFHVA